MIIALIVVWILTLGAVNVSAQEMPCAVPPFIGTAVDPNVMILLDNSGSMLVAADNNAYTSDWIYVNLDNTYYGYFDPTKKYSFHEQGEDNFELRDLIFPPDVESYYRFYRGFPYYRTYYHYGYFYEDPNGEWDGNLLNALTTTRTDAARKVLTGGRYVAVDVDYTWWYPDGWDPRYDEHFWIPFNDLASRTNVYLVPNMDGRYIQSKHYFTNRPGQTTPFSYNGTMYSRREKFSTFYIYNPGNRQYHVFTIVIKPDTNNYKEVKISPVIPYSLWGNTNLDFWVTDQGVLARLGEGMRTGLEFLNHDEGGRIVAKIREGNKEDGEPIGLPHFITIVAYINADVTDWYMRMKLSSSKLYFILLNAAGESIANKFTYTSTTWTPLAEATYEALRYYRQQDPYYYWSDYTARLGDYRYDPLYSESGEPVYCRKNFMIVITDGEPTQDRDVPSWIEDADDDNHDPYPPGADPSGYPWAQGGSDYLDDVAFWAHTHDIRTDEGMIGKQTVDYYIIKVFGTPSVMTLRDAAINGNFVDKNGNNIPDLQSEWDEDNDGVPDAYFVAENGQQLADALTKTFLDILKRASSGSAVAIVPAGTKTEALAYQAYFKPVSYEENAKLTWIGELQAFFVDSRGNLREDTDEDHALTPRKEDTSPYGDYIIKMEFDRERNKTVIRRYADPEGDGIYNEQDFVDEIPLDDVKSVWKAGEWLWNESPDNRNIMVFVDRDRDGKADDGEVFSISDTRLANYAEEYMGVSNIDEAQKILNYIRGVDYPEYRSRTLKGNTWKLGDIIYSTPTYVGPPAAKYHVLFNDHTYQAFLNKYKDRRSIVLVGANDGMVHAFNVGKIEFGDDPLTPNKKEVIRVDGDGKDLGEELWAFVPFNLLPHLKWLTSPKYCHVYYVDLKVKVADMRIFTSEYNKPQAFHPYGWGTIAIVGMRLGGTYINGLTSSYMAIDITDPENPRLLWEFDDYNRFKLGYTTVYPTVVKVRDKWFVIVGSGPDNLLGTRSSTNSGNIYVLDALTGEVRKRFPLSQSTFIGGLTALDKDMDYSVDVIYATSQRGTQGRVFRILTHGDSNPANWGKTVLISVPKPITSRPTVTVDDRNNVWVYFGTGRYFTDQDETDYSQQYFYGVIDKDWQNGNYTASESDLVVSNDISVSKENGEYVVQGYPGNYTLEEFRSEVLEERGGWKYRLPAGERVVTKPLLIGGAVIFTTFKPSAQICAYGGEGYIYAFFYLTGSSFSPYLRTSDVKHSLGEGLPSEPTIHIGKQQKALVQTSTASVLEVKYNLPYVPRSGVILFRKAD